MFTTQTLIAHAVENAVMRALDADMIAKLTRRSISLAAHAARTSVSVRPTVARSYEAGALVWDGDILVPAR